MARTPDPFTVLDSGKQRRESSTGCVRDNRVGKGRYDLLPVFALQRDAVLYEKGANKYTARNWEKGQLFSWCLDSALRHITQRLRGDRAEDHVAAARFHLASIMHYEEMIERGVLPPGLNDLPTYEPAGAPPDAMKCPKCGSDDLSHEMEHAPGDPWTTACGACQRIFDTAAAAPPPPSPDKETLNEPPTSGS